MEVVKQTSFHSYNKLLEIILSELIIILSDLSRFNNRQY